MKKRMRRMITVLLLIGITCLLPTVWASADENVMTVQFGTGTPKPYTDFAAGWLAAVGTENTDGATVTLSNNWTAQTHATLGTSFGTGAGFGDGGETGAGAIRVPDGKVITLDLNGLTLDRKLTGGESKEGGYVVVGGDGASLTLNDASKNKTGAVTGGNNTVDIVNHAELNKFGGGISVRKNAAFTMNGGTIRGNQDAYLGGGVYVGGNAECIMRGGGIEGNTAVSKDGGSGGGGVYVDPKASFTMYDGVMQNNSTGGSGGGVYAQTGAVFTMHDGVIQNNTAAGTDTLNSGGGGVYANGTFDMLGGAIKGNTALNGGGVSIYKKSTLSGGTVSGNTATANGGGVFIYADCALSGTAIESNKGETGGGVYLWGGTSTLSGSAIRWNTAKNGGGAYIYLGFCDFKSGTVSGNTATANGGGVYIDNQLSMTGGTISGNTAAGAGGGVYIDAKARGFRLDYAPVIKDNVTGGTIANGLLTGGTANNVYLPDGKTITTDNLRDGADIRVTTATAPTAARPVAITDVQTKDFSAFFTSDDPAFGTRSRRQGATMGDGQYVELALPAVEVSHDGGVHYTGYVSYENGWQDAVGNNNTADTVVRLFEDWPAYADAENTTSFGYGAGFGAGNIHVPETRPSRST